MYRTHIQCADVGWAAWLKPSPLSALGLPGGLGRSATQTVSPAAGSAGQGAMRGHPIGAILPILGRGRLGWSSVCLKSSLTPFVPSLTPFVPHHFCTATDWFIQAGSLDMFAYADESKAFMVGGIGDDNERRLAA